MEVITVACTCAVRILVPKWPPSHYYYDMSHHGGKRLCKANNLLLPLVW